MGRLNCRTCGDKVDVVNNEDYVTEDGSIFCDRTCFNLKHTNGSLKRVKPSKGKKKLSKGYICPNCNLPHNRMTWDKKCRVCRTDTTLDLNINIRLTPVK